MQVDVDPSSEDFSEATQTIVESSSMVSLFWI